MVVETLIELPEDDRELLHGICELHVHANPDLRRRSFTELDLAKQMRDVGYRAVLFKNHHMINADRVQIISKIVPGIQVFGGVALNYAVGGINPSAVEAAIGFGAKEVWMPTLDAANQIRKIDLAGYPKGTAEAATRPRPKVEGISILDPSSELIPQVGEVLGLVADADIILGTGHLSLEETFPLVKAARDAGVRKILITHPGWEPTDWPSESLVKLVEMGAILEYCFHCSMPYWYRLDPRRIVEMVGRVGAEKCVIATDFGHPQMPHPIDGMRLFIRVLQALGITEAEIDTMARRIPAKFLGLE